MTNPCLFRFPSAVLTGDRDAKEGKAIFVMHPFSEESLRWGGKKPESDDPGRKKRKKSVTEDSSNFIKALEMSRA